ncbi:MAG: hypothetical protein FWE52_00700 [Alphaproteobacteria bacterium]|nr:hypothetical protein [Alphaproteobacteria bacterium]
MANEKLKKLREWQRENKRSSPGRDWKQPYFEQIDGLERKLKTIAAYNTQRQVEQAIKKARNALHCGESADKIKQRIAMILKNMEQSK